MAGQTFSLTNVIEQWIYNYGYPVISLKVREDGLVIASQSAAYVRARSTRLVEF